MMAVKVANTNKPFLKHKLHNFATLFILSIGTNNFTDWQRFGQTVFSLNFKKDEVYIERESIFEVSWVS